MSSLLDVLHTVDLGPGQHDVIVIANTERSYKKEIARKGYKTWQCAMIRELKELKYLNKRKKKKRMFLWSDDCEETPILQFHTPLYLLSKWGIDD